jgi:hypothetical protein
LCGTLDLARAPQPRRYILKEAMINLKEPWEAPINPEGLEKQLANELHKSHYLYKFKDCVKAIAKRCDNDDVMFEIREIGYVIVHLTWTTQSTGKYPFYKMLPREESIQEAIDLDSDEYKN